MIDEDECNDGSDDEDERESRPIDEMIDSINMVIHEADDVRHRNLKKEGYVAGWQNCCDEFKRDIAFRLADEFGIGWNDVRSILVVTAADVQRWVQWRRELWRIDEILEDSYVAYLRTEHWRMVRERTLTLDGYACRLCKCPYGLQAHHNTYKTLGNEQPLDVITICNECHFVFHKNRKLYRATA